MVAAQAVLIAELQTANAALQTQVVQLQPLAPSPGRQLNSYTLRNPSPLDLAAINTRSAQAEVDGGN